MKKILFVVASNGYQPMEYGEPKRILESAGIEAVTASDKVGEVFATYIDDKTIATKNLDDVVVNEYDGIFFIGGSGALDCLDNEKAYRIIREISITNKLWGAICISTRILAHAGVLNGKKATGWNEDDKLPEIIKKAQGIFMKESLVIDGNLITAIGPSAAKDWGEAILKKL